MNGARITLRQARDGEDDGFDLEDIGVPVDQYNHFATLMIQQDTLGVNETESVHAGEFQFRVSSKSLVLQINKQAFQWIEQVR